MKTFNPETFEIEYYCDILMERVPQDEAHHWGQGVIISKKALSLLTPDLKRPEVLAWLAQTLRGSLLNPELFDITWLMTGIVLVTDIGVVFDDRRESNARYARHLRSITEAKVKQVNHIILTTLRVRHKYIYCDGVLKHTWKASEDYWQDVLPRNEVTIE